MKSLKLFSFILISFLIITSCGKDDICNPTISKVTGKVVNYKTGEAISEVNISTEPATEELITDINGGFSIKFHSDGDYTIYVSKEGYVPNKVSIKAQLGQCTNITIPLYDSIKIIDKPIDDYTVLLLHFNQDFKDYSNSKIYKNVINKKVKFSESISKFGGNSAYFDGNSYLTIPNNADLNFGTGDWTIDFWVYPIRTGDDDSFIYSKDDNKNNGVQINHYYFSDNNHLNSLYFEGRNQNIIESWTPNNTFQLNTWSHIALVKYQSTLTIYINGINQTVISYTRTEDNSIDAWIGFTPYGQALNYFVGYLDEFRISKGIARWTSNFVPPNNEY